MMPAIEPQPSIPPETKRAARSLYNLQHVYLRIGDQLPSIYDQIDVTRIDPSSKLDGDPAIRLALASAFQLAEGLPDALAADATLRRMDWKYALYLPVRHPGISEIALCEFRQGLFSSPSALNEFGALLSTLDKFGLFDRSTHTEEEPGTALNGICQVSRLYQLQLAMKAALVLLVTEAPEWLLAHVSPHWYERYKTDRLTQFAYSDWETMEEDAIRIGRDIQHLLNALKDQSMSELSERVEIRKIAHLMKDNFENPDNQIRWLVPACANCICRSQGSI